MDELQDVTKSIISYKTSTPKEHVDVQFEAGSIIVNARVSAPGGWSQARLDNAITNQVMTNETQETFEFLIVDIAGLEEAAEGEMVVGQLSAVLTKSMTPGQTEVPMTSSRTPALRATSTAMPAETSMTTAVDVTEVEYSKATSYSLVSVVGFALAWVSSIARQP